MQGKSDKTKAYSTNLIHRISPLRLQNLEDIESNHQLDKSHTIMDLDKVYLQQQKNSIR